jgi:hypothetical protein
MANYVNVVWMAIITLRVTETIIKSLKLQLRLKKRAKSSHRSLESEFKVRSSNLKFQVLFSVDRLPQSEFFWKFIDVELDLATKREIVPHH